jgi:hypothetical protein
MRLDHHNEHLIITINWFYTKNKTKEPKIKCHDFGVFKPLRPSINDQQACTHMQEPINDKKKKTCKSRTLGNFQCMNTKLRNAHQVFNLETSIKNPENSLNLTTITCLNYQDNKKQNSRSTIVSKIYIIHNKPKTHFNIVPLAIFYILNNKPHVFSLNKLSQPLIMT